MFKLYRKHYHLNLSLCNRAYKIITYPLYIKFMTSADACAVTKLKMADFFTDPATLVGLGTVAAAVAYYVATRPAPMKLPYPLDNQSVELLVF